MRRRRLLYSGIVFVAILLAGFVHVLVRRHNDEAVVPPATVHVPQTTLPKAASGQPLAHIFIIVEENETAASIVGNKDAPYINSLIRHYSLATNYSAVSHPSLPNYLALTSGSTDGISNDCNPPNAGCEVNVTSVADEIEKSGRTWKAYEESMPSNCYAYNLSEYATKHDPFVYYSDILNNAERCKRHVVPFTQLASDLSATQTTPNYAFITPNLCDDMHDCSVATGDSWLAKYVPPILESKAFTTQNSLLIVTWDEGNSSTNRVATILIGPGVKTGYTSDRSYSHYSLLRTIESKWSLPFLTNNDRQASPMNEFFK